MSLEAVVYPTISGLSVGLILFIIAVGLVIIFSVLEVLNLAHGSIYMLGVYLTYQLFAGGLLKDIGALGFLIVLIAAPVACALFGLIMEVVVIRPIYKREMIYQFILTFALIFIIGDIVKLIWGPNYLMVAAPEFLRGPLHVGGLLFPKYNLFAMVLGVGVYTSLYYFFQKTKMGMIMRAVTTDREMVSALGKNVPMIYSLTFTLGCFLAGLGGAVMAPIATVAPGIDGTALVISFVIIVIGGFGSITGAFIAALMVGLLQAWGMLVLPRMALLFPFALMALVLIFKPWGLMGKPMEPKG